MKILSWDVGILNLAYCLIEYNNETDWKIIDWDLINLTNREKIKCFDCGKNPSLCQEIYGSGIKIYTCKTHCKKLNNTPPEFNVVVKEITEEKTCQFESKKKCDKKAVYNFNGINYCKTHCKSEYNKFAKSYEAKPFSKKSVKSIDLGVLRLNLIKQLDLRKNLLEADIVVIENQPTLKNPRMKAISSTVYDYYLIRGIIDKEITKSKIEKVKYMCPSNKLKLADDGDTQKLVKLKGDEAKTYKLTKALGIKYCKEMIKKYPEWLEKINSHKKQDDLADAFLQGMYYIINN